jgi:hypothetical protein
MGKIFLSRKLETEPERDARYWANRGMNDFMASKAWLVPFEGEMKHGTIERFRDQVYEVEDRVAPPEEMIGVHVEWPFEQKYLIVTVGCFAT